MQPALQTPSKREIQPGFRRQKNLNYNNPDTDVRLDGSHLVQMYSALIDDLLPCGPKFDLKRPDQIPEMVKFHTAYADQFRVAGEVDAYYRHAQAAALLKKVEFPLFDDICRANAMEKWFAAEEACREMNAKMLDILEHPHTTKHVELKAILVELRAEVRTLLGDTPPDEEKLAEWYGFGPGADSSHNRVEGHAAYKQIGHSALNPCELEILAQTAPSLCAYGGNPLAAAMDVGGGPVFASFEEARLTFVPKTCSEHRTIEIMPSLSTFRAKAYDHFIRKRLEDVYGIDLTDQEPNRHLAFLGSLRDDDDSPVTLDLSSASDRVSMGLIRLVFPVAWSIALFGLRAKSVVLPDGTTHILEKFASMGNSITFSLQTAIYAAIIVRAYRAAGLRWKKWRAYGDDLIVIKAVAPRVIADLELVGFKLNHEKSFIQGPFRESCGHDYLQGQYVRPFFIKKPIRTVQDVYKYVNVLQTYALRSPIPASAYRGLLRFLLTLIPVEFFVVGHPAYGLEACIWSPYVVVPKRILRAREVEIRVPEHLALRVALLIGAGDSEIVPRAEPGVCLEKDEPNQVYTPSQLKRWKADRQLRESARTLTSRALRTVTAAPTGQRKIIVRRPGKPGLSPLSDNEVKRLMDPFLVV